ncbi:TetR/AcrR family transcriptional regulator [Haloechinothrix aidingensis]|uniref:TetR/AcrR family transcriptional regulator n=1 Tax=Haloechinothrix aidingensis TaxID=2752311 RepID=UPI001FEB58C2|nr:TetR/AcrR family transcriptional regulator [Haloechinothrix aidingensis]
MSREAVVATAVRVIDSEGLAACSLPRLARELSVKAPSLYHHFDDRADIMAEVARYIVWQTPIPKEQTGDWIEWFVELAVNFRRTILDHPNAAQILLEYVPRDVLSTLYDNAARRLQEANVPSHLHVMILDGVEALCLGSGLTQAMRKSGGRSQIFPAVNHDQSALAAAVTASHWTTAEEVFAEVLRNFLRGVTMSDEPARSTTPVSL